ncbi:hypothetical protein DYB38_012009 [Aphanomyces astaci]|nr:hypothetical protein DYB38_012009 [Aphanomyces astaci]
MRFFYMKSHGDTLTSWNVVFYIFMFLKGMAMFVVILLIGTGWSILKQHLNRTEKRIVFVVLLLQPQTAHPYLALHTQVDLDEFGLDDNEDFDVSTRDLSPRRGNPTGASHFQHV